MKTSVIIFIFIFFSLCACKKESYFVPLKEINACGVDDPLNQLNWLNRIVAEGQNVSTANFVECVWIIKLNEENFIVIEFGLTSSMYSVFNCSGEEIDFNNQELSNSLSENQLIYKYK